MQERVATRSLLDRSVSGNLVRVHIWNVTSDPKTGGYTHRLKTAAGHSLLAPLTSSVFDVLGVSASVYDGRFWWTLHSSPSLVPFEVEHGVEVERWNYDGRSVAWVVRRKKALLGEHAGHLDFFVPVIIDGDVAAVLVVGSFAARRPKSTDVLERWRWMTGRQGHPADPAFSAYLRTTLSILVLEGGKVQVFERLLGCLAKLLAGDGRADELATEAHALRLQLEPARFVDRAWEAARTMIDERSSQAHYSAAQAYDLHRLGLSRAADHVLVGLARTSGKDMDPVEELIVRDAFQRSAVELAHAAGDAIAGRVGDHGVVVLSAAKGSAHARQQKLLALGNQLASVAERRFGLTLHFGARLGSGAVPLSVLYQDALGAAESALTSGTRLVIADPAAKRSPRSLRHLREELGREVEEHPSSLPAKFDRYLETVAVRSRYRIDLAAAELEMCLERVADTLLRSGALDKKTWSAMCEGLDRAASEASTVSDLFAAYRRAVAEMVEAVRKPITAQQDRSLRGALDHIHQHYAEALTLLKIARVAGFAPKYFSSLFRKREGITFERYVFRLRIERAKHLLTGTDLDATRVAELSGLKTPQHLCHAFRRALGVTPLAYRASQHAQWPQELDDDATRGRGARARRRPRTRVQT